MNDVAILHTENCKKTMLVVCNSVEGNEIQTHAKPMFNYFDVKYFTIHRHHFRLLDGMTERKPIQSCR